MDRRLFLAAAAAAVLSPLPLKAGPTTAAEVERIVSAGGPVLIHVTAPWCGACRKQKPIVAEFLATPEMKALTKVDVDFDTQRDVLAVVRVQSQATLVLFLGGREIARLTGETRRAEIETFLGKAIRT